MIFLLMVNFFLIIFTLHIYIQRSYTKHFSLKISFRWLPTTWEHLRNYKRFCKQCFFSTQYQYYLTFSWIDLQMLLRCCLINTGVIILRHFLCLLYLYPCLGLCLFLTYLCNVFFIFVFNCIMINCIISWIQIHLFFCLFFRIYHIGFG